MKIAEKVLDRIDEAKKQIVELEGALAEAERLADQFADVKPIPYSIPIERYYGMPVQAHIVKQP